MKKTRVYLLLFISISTLRAQELQPIKTASYFDSDFFYNDSWLLQLNPEGKKIREVIYTSSKHPKDHNYTALNSLGQVTERKYTNRWGFGFLMFKNFIHRKNEYSNGDLRKVEFLNENGEVESYHLYDYTFLHRSNHAQTFKKGKKVNEDFTDYNADSTQKEYRSYKIKNDKQKLVLRYEYDYYPDKQKKETRQFDRKGKLKYTWKYDCNPKGEVVKKESQVCKNTGFNNKGHIVDVIFHTNAQGKKTKTVHTYYMFNGRKIHVANEIYMVKNGKEIKRSDVHLADSIEPYYCYRNYDKKGIMVMENKVEYSSYSLASTVLKKAVYRLFDKGKVTVRWETSYDVKGLPLVSESFDKKNKSLGKAVYKYESENLYMVNHYNKKQKLTEVYTGKVNYH
jgi:hypothetical protein